MQTSLAFLGVISLVLVGSQFTFKQNSTTPVKNIGYVENDATAPITWKIMITGSNISCEFTKLPDPNSTINPESTIACNEAFPDINDLGRIDTDGNGNITLYSSAGEKLAFFMESESGFHESVWPQYPLMTLAQIN